MGLDDPDTTPICEFCGGVIKDLDQKCPALDDGYCVP